MAKVGRPTKYKKEMCKSLIDYFNIQPGVDVEPRFLCKWCYDNGISQETMLQWATEGTDYYKEEFSEAYKVAKKMQEVFFTIGAMMGHYNASFTGLAMKNMFEWRSHDLVVDNSKHYHVTLVSKLETARKRRLEEITAH